MSIDAKILLYVVNDFKCSVISIKIVNRNFIFIFFFSERYVPEINADTTDMKMYLVTKKFLQQVASKSKCNSIRNEIGLSDFNKKLLTRRRNLVIRIDSKRERTIRETKKSILKAMLDYKLKHNKYTLCN